MNFFFSHNGLGFCTFFLRILDDKLLLHQFFVVVVLFPLN